MAVTAVPYGQFLTGLGEANYDFTTNTIKVLLATNTYTPDQDTHATLDDITGEVTGTGYTAGGQALAGLSWTYDATNNRAVLTATALTWAGLSATFHYAIVYKSTGTSSTSLLIGYIDLGEDKVVSAEDYVLNFGTGVTRIKAA